MSTRLNMAVAMATLTHVALLSLPLAQRNGDGEERQTSALSVRLVGGAGSSKPASTSGPVRDPTEKPVTSATRVTAIPRPNPPMQTIAARTATVSGPPTRHKSPHSIEKPEPPVTPPPDPAPAARHRPATARTAPKPIKASSAPAIAQDSTTVNPETNNSNRPEPNHTGASSAIGKGTEKRVPLVPPLFGLAYLANPKPRYPLVALRRGIEGRVLLRVRVSTEGRPVSTAVEHSSGHRMLDLAALRAVKRWRFVPAHRGDEPVEAYALVPVQFHLNG